jgi:hypothetical protein
MGSLMVIAGIVLLIFAVGFAFNMDWAIVTWPWPDGPFSHLFEGSILAAIAVALIWIGALGEWGALPAGSITVLVMSVGMAFYLFQLSGQPGRQSLVPAAIWFAFMALTALVLLISGRRFPVRDARLTPMLVRVSSVVFAVVLVLTASALILRAPNIFPWPLDPDSSVMFGCIFLGDACYLVYSALRPRWHDARSQMLSFLAYDLFLIPPFIGLFATVQPEHMLSLVIYTIVLVYSGLLAVYYLFIDSWTRGWAIQSADKVSRASVEPSVSEPPAGQ